MVQMANVNDKFLRNILYTLQDISESLRKLANRDEPADKTDYIPPWANKEKKDE